MGLAIRKQANLLRTFSQEEPDNRYGNRHARSRQAQIAKMPAASANQELRQQRREEGSDADAGVRESQGKSASPVKPVGHDTRVGHGSRSHSDQASQGENRVKMPQRGRNETQRHKTRRKTPQRGDDHASRAVTIHEQTCAWRSNCHHDVEDGNRKGYGAATGLQFAGKGLGKDAEGVDDHRSRAERHPDGTNQYDPPASKESVAAIAGADPLRHRAKYIRASRPLVRSRPTSAWARRRWANWQSFSDW
jgi:hypothetical protein